MEFIKDTPLVHATAQIENSVIIPPVFIGSGAVIKNSVVGPHVSIGDKTKVLDSRVQNSIIQKDSLVANANIANSMLGNSASYEGTPHDLSVGDFNTIKQ